MFKLCLVACALAVAAAAPVISLDMEQQFKYKSVNVVKKSNIKAHDLGYVQPDGTAVKSVQEYEMKCEADAVNAASCPLPKASAFDHHDGDLKVQERCFLIKSADIPRAHWNKELACSKIDRTKRSIYEVRYDAADKHANKADQLRLTVFLYDVKAPKITQCINKDSKLEATAKGFFCRGTTAIDNVDDAKPKSTLRYTIYKGKSLFCNRCTIEAASAATDSKVTLSTGDYTVYTYAHDFAGAFGKDQQNNAAEISTPFKVQDTTAPVITLVGASRVYHECAIQYNDEGATAFDALDKALNKKVTVYNNGHAKVDHATVGKYTVKFWASDSHKNSATPIFRQVTVRDTTKPSMSIEGHGAKIVMHVSTEGKPAHAERTNSCVDTCDSTRPVEKKWVGAQFNDRKVGKYTRQYTCADKSGNSVTEKRTYQVVDTEVPTITRVGKAKIVLEASRDSTYTDEGAKCRDYVDAELPVKISGDVVAMRTPGTYTIKYSCKDKSGNVAATVKRTVVVQDTTCPTLKVTGPRKVSVEAGFPYADAGATATDTLDGDVTKKIVVTGNTVNSKSSFVNHYSCRDVKAEMKNPVSGHYIITTPKKQRVTVYCDMKYSATYFAVSGGKRVKPYRNNAGDCAKYGFKMAFNQRSVGGKMYKSARAHFLKFGEEESPFFPRSRHATSNYYLCAPKGNEAALTQGDYLRTNGAFKGASPGKYVISYAVADKAGNNQCGVHKRTVTVKDTLAPVISLHMQKPKNHGAKTFWSDKNSKNPATKVRYNPFLKFMAEQTSVNGWFIGAVASAVTGVALLGFSSKQTVTSVPV